MDRQAPPTHPARSVPLGVDTNRLRGLDFDVTGCAWIGLVEDDRRRLLRADPATGRTDEVLAIDGPGSDALYVDHVVPVGDELFVCGGWYPRQILLDPRTGASRQLPLPVPDPEIFNAAVVDGRVYAFDANHGLHVWTPGRWTSRLIPWPHAGRAPFAGTWVEADRASYGPAWWQQGMARTLPLVRCDPETGQWLTFDPPWPDARPMLPVAVGDRLCLTCVDSPRAGDGPAVEPGAAYLVELRVEGLDGEDAT